MQQVSRRSFIAGAAMTGVAATTASAVSTARADTADGISWDYEADVVVIGSGGSGLPAGLKAVEDGASVIVIEANWDCGGHAAVCEGWLQSGAGTDIQKENGVEDSADLYYLDYTYGGVVPSRKNDRAIIRAIADNMVEAYDFIRDKGVLVQPGAPQFLDGPSTFDEGAPEGAVNCDHVPRVTFADATTEGWVSYRGKNESGIGLTRPLERTLREEGGQFLMNYHMDKIIRANVNEGRVLGVMATYTPHIMPGETEPLDHLMHDGDIDTTQEQVYVKANKAVIVCTGGSTGNLTLRTAFDPRLGPEFDGLGGMPFSDQDGSGEMAAMAVGACLGAMGNYFEHGGTAMAMAKRVGCRYGYGSGYSPDSKVWPLVVANGVPVDYDSMILVNMQGRRCGNIDIGCMGKFVDKSYTYFDDAFASVVIDDPDTDGDARRLAGPLWAIFDQATCEAHDWGELEQGTVDYDNGYCFKADTIEELAAKIVNKYYEDVKMDPATLAETVANYNSYVEAGEDPEWGTVDHLVNKIETGPFYAAWATPNLHDTMSGLRVNNCMQVLDVYGEPIEGLYAAGESSAGSRAHGLGRVITTGYIAGRSAAAQTQGPGAPGSKSVGNAVTTEMAVYGEPPAEKDESVQGTAQAGGVKDGNFVGSSPNGQGGELQVQISVDGGKLATVDVIKHNETPTIGGAALSTLISEALDTQSADVDAVAGASVTSAAFSEALGNAMAKAGL